MYLYNVLSDISKEYDLAGIASSAHNGSSLTIEGDHQQQLAGVLGYFKEFLRRYKVEIVKEVDCNLKIDGIRGYLTIQDVLALFSMALTVPKGGTVIEIGSYMGLSTFIMASALKAAGNKKAKIYSVDLWELSPLSIFEENMKRAMVSDMILPLQCDSLMAADTFKEQSADLIFLDADHTYQGCLNDLRAWYPKVKADGAFIGHDYYDIGVDQVKKAVSEFVFEGNLLSNFEKPLYGSVIYFLYPFLQDTRIPNNALT
jgi:predicted O-methyltransferase YrrM